jgi:thymidylate synthase
MNATEVYRAMRRAVLDRRNVRRADSLTQPAVTVEAEPGLTFTVDSDNVPCNRQIDLKWAAANALHFFAATEDARALPKYNRYAERFAPSGVWVGAYGAIAVPQIVKCVELLRHDPYSRRAIVSMGGPEHQDINRPACWSCLHFLRHSGTLYTFCYQRSLNLYGVMPYDCVLLTNIARYVAGLCEAPWSLRWTVGSLHMREEDVDISEVDGDPYRSLWLPHGLLSDSAMCLKVLEQPKRYVWPVCSILEG